VVVGEGGVGTGEYGWLPLPALKEQAHINATARAADDTRDYYTLIRKGRVGFTERR